MTNLNGHEAKAHEMPRILTGPEMAAMRQDSAERRIADLEQRVLHLERLVHALINGPQEGEPDA